MALSESSKICNNINSNWPGSQQKLKSQRIKQHRSNQCLGEFPKNRITQELCQQQQSTADRQNVYE
jgi:hypothetical protein